MSAPNDVPYYALLARYNAAKKLNTAERIELVVENIAEARAKQGFADALATDFGRSVKQIEAGYAQPERLHDGMNGKASAPGVRPEKQNKRTAASRRIARAAFGPDGKGGIDVVGAPEASTDYVGFELSPLRTPGGARFVNPDGATALPEGLPRAGNAVRIDLLGRLTNDDRVTVVQEVKVGGDSDPPIALLQALAYTAALCPHQQYARLQRNYGSLSPTPEPTFEIQIVVAGTIPSARSKRRALWAVMPDLIARLTERSEISGRIRRIRGIRLGDNWESMDGRLSATMIDWADPDRRLTA
jgi:hypothetical protein